MKRIFLSFFLFIMVSIVIWQFASPLVVDRVVQRMLDQSLRTYYQELIKGTYYTILEDIQGLPVDDWPGYVERLQPHFGYPVCLDRIDDLRLSTQKLEQLNKGEIVVIEDGEIFYQRVGHSDRVLTMGAIRDFEASLRIEILVWIMIAINFGLMSLIWALPFWWKLRKISSAAEAFGRGDFNARASLPKRSALFPLAQSFNGMAIRIQQLINAHKELTRAVSHELRTPISRIRFSMEMGATADNTEDCRQYIEEIHKDVDELETLVTELLIYARFDHATHDLAWQARAIAPWLKEVGGAAATGFPGVDLEYRFPSADRGHIVHFEPRFMARALTNLVRNAAKYASSRISVKYEERHGACLIHVDDDGPGIPEKDRQRIFEPFVRLDSSRSRDTGGHGLGLAIVQRVMEWHGGTVSIHRSSLGGARFTLCWQGRGQTTVTG